MELVEKELKNVIYSQEKEKIDIKMKRKALEVIEEPQISFFRDLENVNNKENKSIINNLSNPEKNTIFSLTQSILNLKKNDLNQEQTSINKYILKKFSEYLMSIQRREAVESKLKNILDESSKLDKEISDIESKIRKNKEEITKFQSKIQLKNEKETKKLMELENDLGNIIHEHGKADNQKKRNRN